jgi:hypothetical protein
MTYLTESGRYLADARAAQMDASAAYAIRLANDEEDVGWWTGGMGRYGPVGGVNIVGKVQLVGPRPQP